MKRNKMVWHWVLCVVILALANIYIYTVFRRGEHPQQRAALITWLPSDYFEYVSWRLGLRRDPPRILDRAIEQIQPESTITVEEGSIDG